VLSQGNRAMPRVSAWSSTHDGRFSSEALRAFLTCQLFG